MTTGSGAGDSLLDELRDIREAELIILGCQEACTAEDNSEGWSVLASAFRHLVDRWFAVHGPLAGIR